MLRRISPIHSGSGIPEEQQELLRALQAAQRDLSHAYLSFNDAVDPELVESSIYEIRAHQSRINYLLRRIKAEESREAVAAMAGGKKQWI